MSGVGAARSGLRTRAFGLALVCVTLSVPTATAWATGGPDEPRGFLGRPTSVIAPAASVLPSGFQESTVFSGLTNPTVARFASDGRVFVAEKSGLVKVFASLSAVTPTVVADLRTAVHNFWDRGLLGLALDPNFPTSPYMYVLYAYDAPIGGTAPVWNDACPSPPGATTDGCVVSGRLSRLTISGNTATSEQVLINEWCQQYPSHSIGDLQFGLDGALYVSGGDGASFTFADYGQGGGSAGSPTPKNPCGDPPAGVGGTESPPTAEGGALRSQSLRRPAGEPVLLDGTILRVSPSTGEGLPDNPLASSSNPNARRIVASGLRNPFRFTLRPGTTDLWLGDVGWSTWEELDRQPAPTAAALNFGWPCYEGAGVQSGYQSAGLNICTGLYGTPGAVTGPVYTYNHSSLVVPGESCPTSNGSSITGVAFYNGGSYPSPFTGTLFFADHSRNCIWAMAAGGNGLPNPSAITTFVAGAANPVDLEIGPGGDLFYVDYDGGTIRRIQYFAANQPPTAVASASPTSGPAPLTVNFDGSGSSDPDAGDTITYSWDLNGDGVYGDSTFVKPTYTYGQPGTYTARLRVTDNHGASTTSAPITITVNNTPPAPVIDQPPSTLTWKVGDTITFSGHATDQQDGTLPASALSWTVILHHCTTQTDCHTHLLQTFSGVATGSFSAPDHEYPSYLELQLTATDSGGLTTTTSVRLDPQTVDLTFQSSPSGLQIAVGSSSSATPFTRTVIVGSSSSISATTPQTQNGTVYLFSSWSDGGAATHNIVAPATAATYTATYTPDRPPTAIASAAPTSGAVPLTVRFDGSGSSDPDAGDTITYSWDLNGDGTFGDSTAVAPTFTYTKPGQRTYTVRLRVTDNHGASATTSVTITTRTR